VIRRTGRTGLAWFKVDEGVAYATDAKSVVWFIVVSGL
jgi:hypothetical protein